MGQLLEMVIQNSKYNPVRNLPRCTDGPFVDVGMPSQNRTRCIHYIKLIVTGKTPRMVESWVTSEKKKQGTIKTGYSYAVYTHI